MRCAQVRHNEDKLNLALAADVRWPVNADVCDDPHAKANLLLQAHFSRLPLPIADYVTDTRTTLDNSIRLLQAMIDVCADQGWLGNTLALVRMVQARSRATALAAVWLADQWPREAVLQSGSRRAL